MVVGEIAQEKEVVVIGGGPAGYTAAIRAAQLGKDVLLIEHADLGGVCLNHGCIPSKTFAHAAKQASKWEHLRSIGFQIQDTNFDFPTFKKYKEKVIAQLRGGVESLCKANKIEIINGTASLLSDNRIRIENGHHNEFIHFEHAIIATGAKPVQSTNNNDHQLNSWQLFNVEKLPEQLVLVGADYIVLEAAFAYSQLGTKVSIIIEKNNGFTFDDDIERELRRQLKKRKISLYTGVSQLSFSGNNSFFLNDKGEEVSLEFNSYYIQESSKGNTKDLGLNRAGISTDENGFIMIDKQGRTNEGHIFAVGDVTGGPLLANKAIKQGKVAAEAICGIANETDFTWMPEVIHTDPPIASVGFSEKQARAAGYSVKVGKYSLLGNGFAILSGSRGGFVKVIVNDETNQLLGMHMIGEGAIELISTVVIGAEMVARDEDFLFPTYPHPSVNEAILESMEDTLGLSIHQAPKKMDSRKKDTSKL